MTMWSFADQVVSTRPCLSVYDVTIDQIVTSGTRLQLASNSVADESLRLKALHTYTCTMV